MENKNRCVVPVDKAEFDTLKQQVEVLERIVNRLKGANTTYGGWPPNQKYWLEQHYGLDNSEKKVNIDWANLGTTGKDYNV
jgi:hypothetical protein